jgi:hypothetical protein
MDTGVGLEIMAKIKTTALQGIEPRSSNPEGASSLLKLLYSEAPLQL